MRYGIDIGILGDLADPGRVVELAQAAETAGWEAVFVWDHVAFAWGPGSADPWVSLAAAAQATQRIRLGTAITPLARRRPAVVANTVATLDRLSGGRVVFGAGLGGVPTEFSAFGDPEDARERAGRLDEALEIVAALWSGEQVTHTGPYYTVDWVRLAPLPVQQPRVPIWIGGDSPAAVRRAARWDGWVIAGDDPQGTMATTPEQVAHRIDDLKRQRASLGGAYDIALIGVTDGPADTTPHAYAEAGATWWLEHLHGQRALYADLLTRVRVGPPRPFGTPTGRERWHYDGRDSRAPVPRVLELVPDCVEEHDGGRPRAG